jgi:hypothetical protein
MTRRFLTTNKQLTSRSFSSGVSLNWKCSVDQFVVTTTRPHARLGSRLSPIQGGLDLLGVSDIVRFPKASEALDLLAAAVPVERFAPLRRDLAALYAGYYIGELLIESDAHARPTPIQAAARSLDF